MLPAFDRLALRPAVAVTGNDGLPTLEGLAPTSINGKNAGGSSLDISNNNMLAWWEVTHSNHAIRHPDR